MNQEEKEKTIPIVLGKRKVLSPEGFYDPNEKRHRAMSPMPSAASPSYFTCTSPDNARPCPPATVIPLASLPNQTKVRRVKVLFYYIQLSELEWRIVDTPHFAAKRKVKQMGACIYAYPCATETRWMHQLLVRHFANMTMRLLQQHQPELGITERWIQAVNIAALCHDIGHCTFSHLFDHELLKTFANVPEEMRDHETRGTKLFEWMNRHYKLGLDDAQVRLIQYLITGNSEAGIKENYPGWLFDVVNARNSFDVDKLAYLHSNAIASHGHVRDLQIERILDEERVLNDEICHPRKMHRLLNDVLHHRMLAFLELYRHKLMPKVESILICIFKHMAKALDWEKLLVDPEADGHRWCLEMTDAAIDSLPNLLNPSIFDRLSDMQRAELTKAYELYLRLETREWFETVEELKLVRPEEEEAGVSPGGNEAAALSNLTEISKPTMAFDYIAGYSNDAANNPIDSIKLFEMKPDGIHIKTLRAVLQEEKGTNPHFERHRTVLANEDPV